MHSALITKLRISDRGIKRARFIVLRVQHSRGAHRRRLSHERSRPSSDRDTFTDRCWLRRFSRGCSPITAVQRHEASDQMMVKPAVTPNSEGADPGVSSGIRLSRMSTLSLKMRRSDRRLPMECLTLVLVD
jgi:hypothetical protein